MQKRNAKHGFTLIELLVVLVIVGITAALLAPVMGRAREEGRRAACASNLRQIGIAIHLYADDHGGYLPIPYISSPRTYWFNSVLPYLDNDTGALKCPSLHPKPSHSSYVGSDYAYNACLTSAYPLGGDYSVSRFKISDIGSPSERIIALDIARDGMSWRNYIWRYDFVSEVHSGGSNVVFLGGNVRWYPREVIVANQQWFVNFDASEWWIDGPLD